MVQRGQRHCACRNSGYNILAASTFSFIGFYKGDRISFPPQFSKYFLWRNGERVLVEHGKPEENSLCWKILPRISQRLLNFDGANTCVQRAGGESNLSALRESQNGCLAAICVGKEIGPPLVEDALIQYLPDRQELIRWASLKKWRRFVCGGQCRAVLA
jgi:hypothetical protein